MQQLQIITNLQHNQLPNQKIEMQKQPQPQPQQCVQQLSSAQKDKVISALQSQITKYKAQQIKTNKLLAQLQDKIALTCPNSNNTGSNFMMASEFKDDFQDFMKNCLPNCLGFLLPYPEQYCQFASLVFLAVYEGVKREVESKIENICKVLDLYASQENCIKVKSCLMKIMQDNWENAAAKQSKDQNTNNESFNSNQRISKHLQKAIQFENEQIVQMGKSQQFFELNKKLFKICSYMILQEKSWEFILPDENNLHIDKFNKKDFVCIDGWVKEKSQVAVVLEGLKKLSEDGNYVKHPNLKNYVIPYQKNQEKYVFIPRNATEKQNKKFNQVQKVNQSCQYSPRGQQSTKQLRDISNEIKLNINILNQQKTQHQKKQANQNRQIAPESNTSLQKQNYETQNYINQKYKRKIQAAIKKMQIQHTDSVLVTKNSRKNSPFFNQNLNMDKIKKQNSNTNTNKDCQINNSNSAIKSQNYEQLSQSNSLSTGLIKSSKLNKNVKNSYNLISDPSFEQILTLPQRKKQLADQLPLKKQPSRAKKSNSRKTSAGKIVGQSIQSKQNYLSRNNKQNHNNHKCQQTKEKDNCSRQALYKDMIKQKLGGEYKTQREKPKEIKNKNKDREEDRPLRIMHFKKIREKYLNL